MKVVIVSGSDRLLAQADFDETNPPTLEALRLLAEPFDISLVETVSSGGRSLMTSGICTDLYVDVAWGNCQVALPDLIVLMGGPKRK
jgi:hypothetical protein